MANERVIISRIMNDNFVLVLYKRFGIPKIMNLQIYIDKVDLFRDNLYNIINSINGEIDYFDNCNGNNDFLFDNWKKWKYLIKAHFEDKQDNYIYIIKNLKDLILEELDLIKYNKEHKLDNKFTINFNK